MKPRRLMYASSDCGDYKPFVSLFDEVFPISDPAKPLLKRDLVLFAGGTDVNPRMYGESPGPYTSWPDSRRDTREINIFYDAAMKGLPMVGICRGAQLITALTGGKLIQHMEGHRNTKPVLFLDREKKRMDGICDHHQACIPNIGAEFIAHSLNDNIPEIWWIPKIKALCIQGHPAWGTGPYTDYCVNLVKDLILGGKTL